jgi:hypothetical protein
MNIALQDGMGTTKRSRSFAHDESPRGFEALVLEELEDVVFQVRSSVRRHENKCHYLFSLKTCISPYLSETAKRVCSEADQEDADLLQGRLLQAG